jgi:hypothetical protein
MWERRKRATFGSLLCRCCCCWCWCCCRRNDGYLFIVLSWCSICGWVEEVMQY